VGIEIDPAYAADAEARLDSVVCGDLEQLARGGELAHDLGRFDTLVCGDVLEHLVDPWAVLRAFAALLEPGGRAVVSLPNIRYWDTFRQLGLRGTFPRQHFGIFDRTHLRWFTLRDATELIEQADLVVEEVSPQLRIRPIGSRFDRYIRWMAGTPLRHFFAYQFVIGARRA
jgi:2-polyprenyl-3-methyl-5-hydroxy-6-metoxy-1,4-benzoquinol methylase